MGKYFGTDGFRGEAGITLTADHAYKVGRFLGWYYNALRERNNDHEPARIVIGKDTRRSSYMFEYSLVAGLTASGADAYLLHVTTTPSVAYIARVDDFDCGIMISASHNPYYDNGIKLIDCYGEKMPEETLLLVEDYIDGKLHVFDQDWPELPFAHREHIGCTVDYVAGRNRYMGYLISLGIYSFKGVKVGLDCANGSSWNIAKSVFDALGADTYVINAQPNGTNINNNAGSTHIEGLQKFVVEKGLDVGFAYDGDADRCLCVDEKGNVITGDHILYIYVTEQQNILYYARMALCRPGAFLSLWSRNIGSAWPELYPRCRSPPPHSDLPKKSEWRKGRWKLPSIITDKLWPWRLRWKSMNFLTGPITKRRTCSMNSGGIGMAGSLTSTSLPPRV